MTYNLLFDRNYNYKTDCVRSLKLNCIDMKYTISLHSNRIFYGPASVYPLINV